MQTTTATSGLDPGPNGAPVVNHNGSINRGNVFTPGGNNQHQVSQMAGLNNNSIQLPMVGNGLNTANSAKRSLNRDARKRELLKITMENQAILRRLQDQQPNYNVIKWEEENQQRKRLLKNICEYPYQIDQP